MGAVVAYQEVKTEVGFTITEIVVVIAVTSIGLIMLSSLFSSIQYSQRNDLYITIATHTARAEIEYLRSGGGYSTVKNGDTFTVPSSLPSGSAGSIQVSIPTNDTTSKQVDVTVSYPLGSITKQVTLSAYIDPPRTSS